MWITLKDDRLFCDLCHFHCAGIVSQPKSKIIGFVGNVMQIVKIAIFVDY